MRAPSSAVRIFERMRKERRRRYIHRRKKSKGKSDAQVGVGVKRFARIVQRLEHRRPRAGVEVKSLHRRDGAGLAEEARSRARRDRGGKIPRRGGEGEKARGRGGEEKIP